MYQLLVAWGGFQISVLCHVFEREGQGRVEPVEGRKIPLQPCLYGLFDTVVARDDCRIGRHHKLRVSATPSGFPVIEAGRVYKFVSGALPSGHGSKHPCKVCAIV